MALEKLDTLENSLGRLLDGIDVLKTEKHEWKGAIGLKDLEIKGLKKKMKQMSVEKEAVRKKVDLLLKRLEGLTSDA
jgi:FtsZ-binding cell division protein ZapB